MEKEGILGQFDNPHPGLVARNVEVDDGQYRAAGLVGSAEIEVARVGHGEHARVQVIVGKPHLGVLIHHGRMEGVHLSCRRC